MGYGITAYVVDGEAVRRAFGSRDEALVVRVATGFRDEIADLDDGLTDEIGSGAPRMELALEELIAGNIGSPEHAYAYVYALELLCRALGERMSNEVLGRFSTEGARRVDEVLAEKGVLLTVSELTGWAPPIALPPPEGLPGCTTVDHERSVQLALLLESIDVDALRVDVDDDMNEFIRDAIGEMLEWVTGARDLACGVVVCFYH